MNNEQCLETETLCRVYLSLNPEHTATETKTFPITIENPANM